MSPHLWRTISTHCINIQSLRVGIAEDSTPLDGNVLPLLRQVQMQEVEQLFFPLLEKCNKIQDLELDFSGLFDALFRTEYRMDKDCQDVGDRIINKVVECCGKRLQVFEYVPTISDQGNNHSFQQTNQTNNQILLWIDIVLIYCCCFFSISYPSSVASSYYWLP